MAIPSYKNRVGMSVSGTPGTGTITLDAAESGRQSLATAYGADANVDVLIVDGTAWEVARDCTYTHSGTTLTRGTLEASSTGSALSLTSAAKVYVTETAHRVQQGLNLEHTAGSDANTTLIVGAMHVFDVGAFTADRTATLPATAAVGDRCGIIVSTGDDAYELLITAASGDTLNGIAGGTEWSRVFITGEVVIMRCIVANATWVVEYDGRIPMQGHIELTTAATTGGAATYVYASGQSGVWTSKFDVGNLVDTATDKITIRRACRGLVFVGMRSNSTVGDGTFANVAAELNAGGTGAHVVNQFIISGRPAANLTAHTNGMNGYTFAAGDYIRHTFRTEEANKGLAVSQASYMILLETLKP